VTHHRIPIIVVEETSLGGKVVLKVARIASDDILIGPALTVAPGDQATPSSLCHLRL
jgi:hypothetical protein